MFGYCYLTKTADISRYLYRTFKRYGYYVKWNHSDKSESRYLKISVGTPEAPEAIYVRISNHSADPHNSSVRFDYDICGSHDRKEATTYIKFIIKFAKGYGMPIPHEIQALQPGTSMYTEYASELRRQAA